jgi:predicted RNA-binding protein with RPS1 domain
VIPILCGVLAMVTGEMAEVVNVTQIGHGWTTSLFCLKYMKARWLVREISEHSFGWKVSQAEWRVRFIFASSRLSHSHSVAGMVHISNIQQGARAHAASDLLSHGQPVKVKVMSVAGNRISLSMKDVDQTTGMDLSPHLRIKSEAELENECHIISRLSSGVNVISLSSKDKPVRSTKRMSSPE